MTRSEPGSLGSTARGAGSPIARSAEETPSSPVRTTAQASHTRASAWNSRRRAGSGGLGRPAGLRAHPSRRGRAMLVWLAVVIVTGLLLGRSVRRRTLARGFAIIESDRAAVDWPEAQFEPWIDPAWESEVRVRMAEFGRVATDRFERHVTLAAALLELSFVAEVGAPQVLWPDGLAVPVRFHRPVACVRAGERFFPVAFDGTLLSGSWAAPPRRGSGFLPVLTSRYGLLEDAAPGDVLEDAGDQRALRVAASMWEHLDALALEDLGCAVLDPWGPPLEGTEEPSVHLELEGERLILFGRAPGAGAGELSAEQKWEHVLRGLDQLALEDAELDWDLLDVRWDRPEMRLRGELVEAASPAAAGGAGAAANEGR